MDKPPGATFENQLIELDSVDSTNNYAMARIHAGLASAGQIYFAHHQWAGRGRRGKRWTSDPGQNISMSLVLKPRPLPLSDQFLLGAAVAVGCLDGLKKYAPAGWSVKWPNDLYWNDRKAGGILIENQIRGGEWLFAVVGLGVNLNQISFSEDLPNPVSLKQITGQRFEPLVLAVELAAQIQKQAEILKNDAPSILDRFNQSLYQRGNTVKLKRGDSVFECRIESVNARGQLIGSDGRKFDYGEVSFVGLAGH